MGSIDTTWQDATEQAGLVRRGELQPKDFVAAAIARIEAVNPQLDAVIRTRLDEALADAEAGLPDAEAGLPDAPFRGVPILFKDLGCFVAGEVTAFGLGPMRDLAFPVTSYLAEQFRAAGFHPAGPHQCARAWHHGDHRGEELPGCPQPVAAGPFRRRLVRRVGGRGSQRRGAGRARQ